MLAKGQFIRLKRAAGRLSDQPPRDCGKPRYRSMLTGFIVVFTLVGCQPSRPPAKPEGHIAIKRLAILYGQFVGEMGGRPPRDEEQFRKFVESRKSQVQLSVDTPEDMFVSPRDGKPYIIMVGDDARKHLRSGLAIYEQEGVDGLRQVAFSIGMIEEVDDEKLQELLNGGAP